MIKKLSKKQESKTKNLNEAPDAPRLFGDMINSVNWAEVHSSYIQLLGHILNQSQIINYQYKKLISVELFIKELEIAMGFNGDDMKILEDLMTKYGLDRELYNDSMDPMQ
jgi:hypothetical protein